MLFLVQLVHLYIVLFMLIVPFQDQTNLHVLHVFSGLSILTHWLANDNTCFLSLVEAQLRGIDKSKGFVHSLVAPVYELNATQSTMLAYIVLFSMMGISLYRIFTSKKWEQAKREYKEKGWCSFLVLLKK